MFEILKFIWFLLRALLLLLWEEKRKLWLYLHNTVNPSLVSRVLLTALKSFKKKKHQNTMDLIRQSFAVSDMEWDIID